VDRSLGNIRGVVVAPECEKSPTASLVRVGVWLKLQPCFCSDEHILHILELEG
jgi:hypothetical protein